jgi:membrane peptidoglycan carboxypeptidase
MFPAQSTVILDRNGVELYRLFSEQDRTYVHGDNISPFAKSATIAIEDERFLSRSACFDIIGYARAGLSQIAPSIFVKSGGSTLTQQFAGNALVGRERSVIRKVRELMLACELERKYNKDELLELYLNWIPYGHNAYGIEQASKNYFGISAKDLTLAQASVLASLPQRPSYFNPYGSHLH